MSRDDLLRVLAGRAPGQWELYEKTAESREIEATRSGRRAAWRREEGWAVRWWEAGGARFAAASSPRQLVAAMDDAAEAPVAVEPTPDWPSRGAAAPAASLPTAAPEDLFEQLARALAAASRGEAQLSSLQLRRGTARERIVNAAGLDVTQVHHVFDGVASAVARRAGQAREARVPFRWGETPELEQLAGRLSDAATFPLSERPTPFGHGQWLLDPPVAAALLAALAPLFATDRTPRWLGRGRVTAPGLSITDDATADARFDGEGVPTRRMLLADDGSLVGRLHDLRSAKRAGVRSTGHGVRASFRTPPQVGPRRIFFETRTPAARADLLSSVTRGLFASALTAPIWMDLAQDRYEVEFTGVSIVAGRAQGPVAGARAAGRLSELLRRIAGMSADLQFIPVPFLAGSPTLLVERANFE